MKDAAYYMRKSKRYERLAYWSFALAFVAGLVAVFAAIMSAVTT